MSTDLVVATKQVHQQIADREPEFAAALPQHIPVSKFRRVLMTALSKNHELLQADRTSLFQSSMDCAQDGLLPDGREAALVVFKTKVKRDGQEVWLNVVQYMPMVRGILKRMRNTGMVTAPTAQLVYRKDAFRYWVDDDGQHLSHEFDVFADRGDIVGVYARAKTTDGEVHLEVMSRAEVDYIRNTFSKQPNGQMWTKSWGEAARKTVLRRLAKVLPCSTDIDVMIERGDTEVQEIEPAPPRPQLADYRAESIDDPEEQEPEGELYRVLDGYGVVEYEGGDEKLAMAMLQTLLDKAKDDGEREAIREANPDLHIAGVGVAVGVEGHERGVHRNHEPQSDRPSATPIWDEASRRKTKEAIFGVCCVTSPRHWRYLKSVSAWCQALCELADTSSDDDALTLWGTNLTVHTAMTRDFKSEEDQSHLKAAADHFVAIHKSMQGIVP